MCPPPVTNQTRRLRKGTVGGAHESVLCGQLREIFCIDLGNKTKNKTGLTCRRSQEADSTRKQAGFNPLFFLACFRKRALGTPPRIPPRARGLGLFAQGRPRSPLPRLRGSRSMLRRALCCLGHPLPWPPLPPTPQGAPVRTRVPSRRGQAYAPTSAGGLSAPVQGQEVHCCPVAPAPSASRVQHPSSPAPQLPAPSKAPPTLSCSPMARDSRSLPPGTPSRQGPLPSTRTLA